MSRTNCPNCGASKDSSEIKCPFCGTAYLDMTAIDLYNHEPMWLKFIGPNGTVYQVKACPTVANFKFEPQYLDACSRRDLNGRLVRPVQVNNHVQIDLSFVSID